MKLLLDMNLSPGWVSFLLNEGWQTVHWSSIGKATAPDFEIMRFANQHDYVVLTYDLDFSAILAATQGEKPSVVQIRMDDISVKNAGPRLAAALRHTQSELERGALLTINQNRSRIRLLPLKREVENAEI